MASADNQNSKLPARYKIGKTRGCLWKLSSVAAEWEGSKNRPCVFNHPRSTEPKKISEKFFQIQFEFSGPGWKDVFLETNKTNYQHTLVVGCPNAHGDPDFCFWLTRVLSALSEEKKSGLPGFAWPRFGAWRCFRKNGGLRRTPCQGSGCERVWGNPSGLLMWQPVFEAATQTQVRLTMSQGQTRWNRGSTV